MIEHHILAGTHISSAVDDMLISANLEHDTVRADFNDIEIVVAPGADRAQIIGQYEHDVAEAHRRYAASPEGVAARVRDAEDLADRRRRVADTLDALGYLDATDLRAVVEWLIDYTEAADRIGAVNGTQVDRVRGWFMAHRFFASVNTGDRFVADDPDNVARYLIGQALSGINQVGVPHPMMVVSGNRWLDGELLDEAS